MIASMASERMVNAIEIAVTVSMTVLQFLRRDGADDCGCQRHRGGSSFFTFSFVPVRCLVASFGLLRNRCIPQGAIAMNARHFANFIVARICFPIAMGSND